jgi:membrane protein
MNDAATATSAAPDATDAASTRVEAVDAAVRAELAATGVSPRSPEGRRLRAERVEALVERGVARVRRGTRPFEVARRVVVGAYFDGFIHAGNLAYLALIALFPFFITATALLTAFGQTEDGARALTGLLAQLPPNVAETLSGPLSEVLQARTGPLLWIGALVGLWTVGSLIETVRDILRRAYGTQYTQAFWRYRIYSVGIIIGAVVLLFFSFSAQVVTVAIDEAAARLLPSTVSVAFASALSFAITTAGLFLSFYLLFYTLTPSRYRIRRYPKWPGALATTLWWIGVTRSLPPLLASLISYDLTYGSLAGVMVVLFFFYLIGLGVVVGAELNAALAESPEEAADRVGQSDNRTRQTTNQKDAL